MDNNVLAILGISFSLAIVFLIVWYVLQAIAMWKIFTKAGIAGWKSLIPYYREYCLFKLSWKHSTFAIIYLVTLIVGTLGASYCSSQNLVGTLPAIFNCITLVSSILALIRNFKEAKAFGHGTGFGLGLTFLTPIFNLILGFSLDKYLGAQD